MAMLPAYLPGTPKRNFTVEIPKELPEHIHVWSEYGVCWCGVHEMEIRK